MSFVVLSLLLSAPSGWAAEVPSIYEKTQTVLSHFGVSAETFDPAFLTDLNGQMTEKEVQALVPGFDSDRVFSRYASFQNSTHLIFFRDPGTKQVPDFEVALSEASQPAILYPRLQNHSLQGLRVALDPGHMGGDFWDTETGKFVRDSHGVKLSEGVLNLEISLLLEKKLQALGAEVLITHRKLAPVTSLPYKTFDLKPFASSELTESQSSSWFTDLLSESSDPASLFSAFSGASEFKHLFSQARRSDYFILLADLHARAQAIMAFQPDITLIIHLDSLDPPGDPNGINPSGFDATKAYIPGAFEKTELASRQDRAFFARHILDHREREASLQLARAVVGEIHSELGVPLERANGETVRQLEPGIIERNLEVQRMLVGHASAYVECLYYNDPKEFASLLAQDNTIQIDDQTFYYSKRLGQIAEALDQALIRFVENYR